MREINSAATLIPRGKLSRFTSPYYLARRRGLAVPSVSRVPRCETFDHRAGFERHSEDDDMTELPRKDPDRRDWAARASEALAQARKLPAGSMRSEAIRKAEQLGFAADMRKWLIPKKPNGAPKVTG